MIKFWQYFTKNEKEFLKKSANLPKIVLILFECSIIMNVIRAKPSKGGDAKLQGLMITTHQQYFNVSQLPVII